MSGEGSKGNEGEGEKDEEKNMAAWLLGIKTIKIQHFNLPHLGPHDVRVRIKAVGICGSDIQSLQDNEMRQFYC